MLRDAYPGKVVPPLRDYVDPLDADGAYAIQDINTRFWLGQGRQVVGRKAGLTAEAVQRQLGIDQPDFGTLTFTYTPEARCVELKSLKMYLQAFRNEGIFYENVTNRILDDLVAVLQPRRMQLVAAFTPRGGISTNVTVRHEAKK